jgi:hypothetical protein
VDGGLETGGVPPQPAGGLQYAEELRLVGRRVAVPFIGAARMHEATAFSHSFLGTVVDETNGLRRVHVG